MFSKRLLSILDTLTQQLDGAQHIGGDQRLKDVQLEVAIGAADGDGHVVAHHLGADHGHGLALGGIHLAGHNGAARLVLRQQEFAQPAARSGSQEAYVIADLHQAGRKVCNRQKEAFRTP